MQTKNPTPSNPNTLVFPHASRYALQPYLPPPKGNVSNTRLHVTLTYAQSLDGMISLKTGVQTALSGPETKAMTHYLRSVHDAILIGTTTAYTDDPSLNCRFGESFEAGPVGLENQPVPVILDPYRKWKPENSKIVKVAREGKGKGPLWVVVGKSFESMHREQEIAVEEVGGEIVVITEVTKGPPEIPLKGQKIGAYAPAYIKWESILEVLGSRGIKSVMVEGGARVINGLYSPENRGIVSSVIITNAPKYLGEGGVAVCPKRTKQDQVEVEFSHVMWLPLGRDAVMAARLQYSSPDGEERDPERIAKRTKITPAS